MTELEQLRAERDTLRTQLAATSGALERAREAWARLRPFCPEGSPSMPQWKHSEHFQAARAMDAALAEPTHDAVMVGLEQSARGEVTDLGDFTQCAEHEDNCHFLFMEKPGTCTCKAAPTSGPGEALEGIGELLTAVQPHLECFKTGAPAPSPTCVGGPGSEAPCSTCLIAEEVAAQLRALAGTPDATKEETT